MYNIWRRLEQDQTNRFIYINKYFIQIQEIFLTTNLPSKIKLLEISYVFWYRLKPFVFSFITRKETKVLKNLVLCTQLHVILFYVISMACDGCVNELGCLKWLYSAGRSIRTESPSRRVTIPLLAISQPTRGRRKGKLTRSYAVDIPNMMMSRYGNRPMGERRDSAPPDICKFKAILFVSFCYVAQGNCSIPAEKTDFLSDQRVIRPVTGCVVNIIRCIVLMNRQLILMIKGVLLNSSPQRRLA